MRLRRDGGIEAPLKPPRAVRVLSTSAGPTVLWTPPTGSRHGAGVHSYRVYRDGKPVATIRGNTWFVDRGAQHDGHRYDVRAVDRMGLSSSAMSGVGSPTPQEPAAAAQDPAAPTAAPAQNPATSAAAPATSSPSPAPSQGATSPSAAAPSGAAPAGAAPTATPATPLQPPLLAMIRPIAPGVTGIAWKPVAGAASYGVYANGKLLGHVKNPAFAGHIAASGATMQFDAVDAQGNRSERSTPTRVPASPQKAPQQPAAAPAPA